VVTINEPFEVELEEVTEVKIDKGRIINHGEPYHVFTGEINASHKAVNILLEEGLSLYRTRDYEIVGDEHFMPRAFIVEGHDLEKILEP
jgi:hypothetical protein